MKVFLLIMFMERIIIKEMEDFKPLVGKYLYLPSGVNHFNWLVQVVTYNSYCNWIWYSHKTADTLSELNLPFRTSILRSLSGAFSKEVYLLDNVEELQALLFAKEL